MSGDGTTEEIEETVTSLVNNNNGTFTYTSEDGSITIYDETTTTISLNANNSSFDYTDENGVTTNYNLCTVVDNCETVTALYFDSVNNELEYVDENGVTNTIVLNDLVSSMSDDNDAADVKVIATHTAGDGTTEVIEETVTSIDFNTSTNQIEYTDEK